MSLTATKNAASLAGDAGGLPAAAVSTHQLYALQTWQLLRTDADAISHPDQLPSESAWQPAVAPGTVASALGPPELTGHADYDASDWWYRCSFERPASAQQVSLRFDGLATIAEVWLNGQPLLRSENMFHTLRRRIDALLIDKNELVIVFRSLNKALEQRLPRGRFKTTLVENQRLRWFRTCLLGRIPGWSPRLAAVGPWRPVWLQCANRIEIEQWSLVTGASSGAAHVIVNAQLRRLGGSEVPTAASLQIGDRTIALALVVSGDEISLATNCMLADIALWYPHTHGEPALHDCKLRLQLAMGDIVIAVGRIGFREITLERADGAVRFCINELPIFYRGGCWTHHDIRSLAADDTLTMALQQLRDSGANMVRVSGTSVYQSDRFYELCDALGICVWQDFMFASMDYPLDDPAFRASSLCEVAQQLSRFARHPSIAVYCGNSEVAQQAAMMGAPRQVYEDGFFATSLADEVTARHPGTPYLPSSPCGGALPFFVGSGVSHYFGVGAYRRPLSDARLAGVRFASECLALANIPEPETLSTLSVHGPLWPHHPAWKAAVPRDAAAGWDFDDIRDHYLHELTGLDAIALRCNDPARYHGLSRVCSGWVMERVYAEWRAHDSGTSGGLMWYFRDLQPGAGWGVVDALGKPKAAYFALKRAWAARTVALLDRGLDGLTVSLVNACPASFVGTLSVAVIANGSVQIASGSQAIELAPFSACNLSADAVLGFFHDLTHSYRFGPQPHEAVVAQLLDETGAVVAETVHRLRPGNETPATDIRARLLRDDDSNGERAGAQHDNDRLWLELSAEQLVFDLRIDVRDHLPADNYFILTPGRPRRIELKRIAHSGRALRGFIEASNMRDAITLERPS